jgi:hypothetical protein
VPDFVRCAASRTLHAVVTSLGEAGPIAADRSLQVQEDPIGWRLSCWRTQRLAKQGTLVGRGLGRENRMAIVLAMTTH